MPSGPNGGNKHAKGRKANPTKRQRARELLLAGQDVNAVAAAVGVARSTVLLWRAEPEFARRLEAHREALLKIVEDNNVHDLQAALAERRRIMTAAEKDSDRLRAIEGIIAMATETRKQQAAVTIVQTKVPAEDLDAVRRHFAEDLKAEGWKPPETAPVNDGDDTGPDLPSVGDRGANVSR